MSWILKESDWESKYSNFSVLKGKRFDFFESIESVLLSQTGKIVSFKTVSESRTRILESFVSGLKNSIKRTRNSIFLTLGLERFEFSNHSSVSRRGHERIDRISVSGTQKIKKFESKTQTQT